MMVVRSAFKRIIFILVTALLFPLCATSKADEAFVPYRIDFSSLFFEGMVLVPKSCTHTIRKIEPSIDYFECEFPKGFGKFWLGYDSANNYKKYDAASVFLQKFKQKLNLQAEEKMRGWAGSSGNFTTYILGSVDDQRPKPHGSITHFYKAKFLKRVDSSNKAGFLIGMLKLKEPIPIAKGDGNVFPRINVDFEGFDDVVMNYTAVDPKSGFNRFFNQ